MRVELSTEGKYDLPSLYRQAYAAMSPEDFRRLRELVKNFDDWHLNPAIWQRFKRNEMELNRNYIVGDLIREGASYWAVEKFIDQSGMDPGFALSIMGDNYLKIIPKYRDVASEYWVNNAIRIAIINDQIATLDVLIQDPRVTDLNKAMRLAINIPKIGAIRLLKDDPRVTIPREELLALAAKVDLAELGPSIVQILK